jgi:hypothetical protein
VPFARLHAEHRTPCFASNQNSPLTPLLIYVSHSSSKSPSFAMLIQGGVLCSPLVVYVWCYTPSLRLVFTPPTADAYTTRSCFARLPARFGHIILSCGVQFKGNREGECLTAQYRYTKCGITGLSGVLVPCCSSTIQGAITARNCDHTF